MHPWTESSGSSGDIQKNLVSATLHSACLVHMGLLGKPHVHHPMPVMHLDLMHELHSHRGTNTICWQLHTHRLKAE